jgi:protocatechuate 3,4-dioxygenase beta subunit
MTGQIVVTAASAPTATATSTATQSPGGPSPQATPTATGTTAPTVTATDTATAVPSPTVTPLKALKIAVHGKPSVGHRTNLQVRVTGAGGQPVAGASVVCDARKAGVPKQRHAKTGKNGTVTIKSVLPKKRGAIRLTASHSGYKTVSKTVQVKK